MPQRTSSRHPKSPTRGISCLSLVLYGIRIGSEDLLRTRYHVIILSRNKLVKEGAREVVEVPPQPPLDSLYPITSPHNSLKRLIMIFGSVTQYHPKGSRIANLFGSFFLPNILLKNDAMRYLSMISPLQVWV